MDYERQIAEWVKGNNLHDTDNDQCCPDFSCCQQHYKAADDERRLFKDRPELREQMLMGFLSGAMAGSNVYIAGSTEGSA